MRRDQQLLLVASIAAVVMWFFPLTRVLMLPVVYLNTILHELAHALAAFGTLGRALDIRVFADGSGVTQTMGGQPVIVSSAGYVGASVIGAALIAYGRTEKAARAALQILSATVLLTLIVLVRGDFVGILACVFWAIVAYGLSRIEGKTAPVLVVQFIGAQQCLASLQSIATLLHLTSSDVESDATILQGMTGVPAVAWSVAWAILSVAALVVAFRTAWSPRR